MQFDTTIEHTGKTATAFEVPADIVAALGQGKKPRVVVRTGPHTYRSTVAVYAGRFMLPLDAGNRDAAQVSAGDRVRVDVATDDEVRQVDVPADVAALLAADTDVARRFASLSYTARREYVVGIAAAKQPQTRERRIARMLADLGKR